MMKNYIKIFEDFREDYNYYDHLQVIIENDIDLLFENGYDVDDVCYYLYETYGIDAYQYIYEDDGETEEPEKKSTLQKMGEFGQKHAGKIALAGTAAATGLYALNKHKHKGLADRYAKMAAGSDKKKYMALAQHHAKKGTVLGNFRTSAQDNNVKNINKSMQTMQKSSLDKAKGIPGLWRKTKLKKDGIKDWLGLKSKRIDLKDKNFDTE